MKKNNSELIIQYLKEDKLDSFREILEKNFPYDVSRCYEKTPHKYKLKFIENLTDNQLVKMTQQLEPEQEIEILNMLDSQKLSLVLKKMENDHLANLFYDLPLEILNKLQSLLSDEDNLSVEKMMDYPMETAGRIMTDQYIWIYQDSTVGDAINKIKDFPDISELITYLYVINDNGTLLGKISFKTLILSELDELIKDKMQTQVISVSGFTDQEKVAKIIERYDLDSVPVVENDDILIGIITSDDIIDVVIKEASEDIEKISASGKAITFKTKSYIAAWRRLPWLVLLLNIGLISGSIISGFGDALTKVVSLAFFIPLITGMTGNIGTQSLAIMVRGVSAETIDSKIFISVIFRELKVGIILGVVCGILIAIISFLWQGDLTMGYVVGCSLLFTLIIGAMTGTIIPIFLYSLKIDPAVASGPLITTINDILSLLIYFAIATTFITKIS